MPSPSITSVIQSLLVSAPQITSQVPATKISGPDDERRDEVPFIRHNPVAWKPIETHEGLARLQVCEIYQVSIYTKRWTISEAVGRAVINTLRGPHPDGTVIFWRGGFIPRRSEDTKSTGCVIEFRVTGDFVL